MELGGSWWLHSSFLVPFLTTLWFLGFLGSSSAQLSVPQEAASLLLPPPWLGRDSLHPRFLPQRARGTDPVQVLEGIGVSQALRGVWGQTGAWRLRLLGSPRGGKPHAAWPWGRAAGRALLSRASGERCPGPGHSPTPGTHSGLGW